MRAGPSATMDCIVQCSALHARTAASNGALMAILLPNRGREEISKDVPKGALIHVLNFSTGYSSPGRWTRW